MAKLNFTQLVQIDEQYGPKGLQIMMFPSNTFKQENLDAAGIENSYRGKYGAQYFISETIDVNGQNTHPVYSYLR